jgi:hypothetical protein
MKFFKAAALLCAGVASTYALATPAHAASSITVDSPNGDEYASGAEVIVSGVNNSVNTETLSVECDYSSRYPHADVAPGPFSVSVGSFAGPDTCRIYDYDYNQLATFTVARPPTSVSDATVSRDTFYPLVRDGYRDTVLFRWRQDRGARASISVVNADGRTLRTATPYRFRGLNGWTWNGKKDNGDLVAEGRYRIRVTVDSNMVSAGVTVATGFVTKSYRLRKEGNRVSSFSTRGNCYGQRDSYDQVATIDCWGGHHAKANYRFAIPAGAFDVRGTVDLNRNSLDICCQGKITKGWSRPSKRTVALWAQVTGWRTTDVNFVRVTYKKRTRI